MLKALIQIHKILKLAEKVISLSFDTVLQLLMSSL